MTGRRRSRASLAQNLFVGEAPPRRLAEAAGVEPGDRVYDLGAGTGAVTAALVRAGARVVAIERDPNLARKLAARFAGAPVEVVRADLANVAFTPPYRVAANPPFNATAAVLRRLLFTDPAPLGAALVLQREAARKYAGSPRASAVSMVAAPWFAIEIAGAFSRTDFVPRPAVETALLRIRPRPTPLLRAIERPAWEGFVRYVFGRGRSDARGALRSLVSNLQWRRLSETLDLSPAAALADLELEAWLALFRFVSTCVPEHKRRLACGAPLRSGGSAG